MNKQVRRYKDKDGLWLAATRLGEGYVIGWVDSIHDSVDSCLGDFRVRFPPKDLCDWEEWRATEAAKPYATATSVKKGVLLFPSYKKAKEALRAANEALSAEDTLPWPKWALLAHKAGWLPPPGWAPTRKDLIKECADGRG